MARASKIYLLCEGLYGDVYDIIAAFTVKYELKNFCEENGYSQNANYFIISCNDCKRGTAEFDIKDLMEDKKLRRYNELS